MTEALSPPGTGGDPARGFAKAVEMCNNNGHCRKFDAGTMCPSYRVTRDEQHLTRGRANTLRLALSGQLGPDAMSSDAVYDTMDLCVACKGCKRDCPTGVDMSLQTPRVVELRTAAFNTSPPRLTAPRRASRRAKAKGHDAIIETAWTAATSSTWRCCFPLGASRRRRWPRQSVPTAHRSRRTWPRLPTTCSAGQAAFDSAC